MADARVVSQRHSQKPVAVGHTIVNTLAFQCAWFDLIVFKSGLAFVFIALLALQLWKVYGKDLRHLIQPLAALFCLGVMIDSMFGFSGVYQFEESTAVLGAIPYWLVMLWLGFVLTLPICFAWLLSKPVLAIVVFASLAPVSYAAGRHLDVLAFSNASVLLISSAWALVAYLSCRWLVPAMESK